VGRDRVVGAATRYGLDGPGIESRCGRDFPPPFIPAPEPTQPPIQWVPGLSRGVNRPERGVDHPPPYTAEWRRYFLDPSRPAQRPTKPPAGVVGPFSGDKVAEAKVRLHLYVLSVVTCYGIACVCVFFSQQPWPRPWFRN